MDTWNTLNRWFPPFTNTIPRSDEDKELMFDDAHIGEKTWRCTCGGVNILHDKACFNCSSEQGVEIEGQSIKRVRYLELIGWECYGRYGDTPEMKLKRGWWDNDDPATLQFELPRMPTP